MTIDINASQRRIDNVIKAIESTKKTLAAKITASTLNMIEDMRVQVQDIALKFDPQIDPRERLTRIAITDLKTHFDLTVTKLKKLHDKKAVKNIALEYLK
jgi:hypothetical protein